MAFWSFHWFIGAGRPVFLSRSLSFNDAHQPLEIVSHRLEREFQLVPGQPQVTDSPVVLPFLEMRRDALNLAAHERPF